MKWIEFNNTILCPETGALFYQSSEVIGYLSNFSRAEMESFSSPEQLSARWEELKEMLGVEKPKKDEVTP